MTKQLDKSIVEKWYNTIDSDDPEAFLDFMQGLHVNETTTENGERVMYFEDGNYYIAHGFRLGENDSPEAKAIIERYEEYGGEYD